MQGRATQGTFEADGDTFEIKTHLHWFKDANNNDVQLYEGVRERPNEARGIG